MDKKTGCLVGCLGMIAAVMAIPAGLVVLVLILAVAASSSINFDESASIAFGSDIPESGRPMQKVWIGGEGDEGSPKILRVKIDGVIADVPEGLFGREKASAISALKKIRAATKDDDLRGLYLVIDSPGGEVTLSDVIADAVQRFKNSGEGRFVVVEMGALCCSGGYYIAAGADRIVAHPTTITGSIGVLMSSVNAADLARKIGIESVVIATGENKAMLDPLKPVDPGHVEILRKAVDADYERFLSVVSKGRKLPVDKIRPLADGRIFSAEEAKELKLVDEIGYAEDVEALVAEMAKSEAVRIYRYKDDTTLRDIFNDSFFSSQGMSRTLRLVSGDVVHGGPAFMTGVK